MKISILQWNILFTEKHENILKLVREIQPDVACFQEFTYKNEFYNPTTDLSEAMRGWDYEEFAVVTRRDTNKAGLFQGDAIFSRLPIVKRRAVNVRDGDLDATDFSKEIRSYLKIVACANGKNLTVGTTHLSYSPRFEQNDDKISEAKNLLSEIEGNRENFILTGDFNSLPNSFLVRELSKKLQNAAPDFREPTWTTKPFDYQDFQADALDWRLDYVFATRDVKVAKSEIIATDFSDHLPILTTIEI